MGTSRRVLRGGASAFGCLLITAVIVVAVPVPHAAEPVAISYSGDVVKLIRFAPYVAVAPAGLPASWQPVSSRLTVGGSEGPATVTWHLGFMTPNGSLASLEESNANAAGFIRRMTNSGTPGPPARLAGRAWQASSTPSRGQRSMYYTSASGVTIIITGNASWAQLRELAASLRPA